MSSVLLFNSTAIPRIFLNESYDTFYVFPLDCLDGYISVIHFVVSFEDISILAASNFTLENIVINHFWHSLSMNLKVKYHIKQFVDSSYQ